MNQRLAVPYLVTVLTIISLLLFAGCGGSGGSDTYSYWGGNGAAAPQIQGITNLNSQGQPVRIGDWCQIGGAGFGNVKGNGSVRFGLQDGTYGTADLTSLWTDTQVICRVPQPKSVISGKETPLISITLYTDSGASSNSYSLEYNPVPNPTPENTPPSPSPSPSATPTPSPTGTISPTPSPSHTASPSPSPTSASPSPTPTAQWWDMGNVPKTYQMYPNLRFSSKGVAYVSYDVYDENLGSSLVCFGTFDSTGYHALQTINVGDNGGFSSLCLNENDVPYLAYCKDDDVYVVKYQNGAFTSVGTVSGATFPSLYVSGVYAYLAYEYQDQGDQLVTAGYFDADGVWHAFLSEGFNGLYPKMTGKGNTPYMLFMDCDSLVAGCFQDGVWTILGDFSGATNTVGLALDSGGELYVAYTGLQEKNRSGKAAKDYSTLNVQVLKNGSWTALPSISASGVIYYPYFFGSPAVRNGTVYLAFSDLLSDNPNGLYKVKQYTGSAWLDTGNLGFGPPEEPNCYIAIALDNSGTPYVFCIGSDASLHLYKYSPTKKGDRLLY